MDRVIREEFFDDTVVVGGITLRGVDKKPCDDQRQFRPTGLTVARLVNKRDATPCLSCSTVDESIAVSVIKLRTFPIALGDILRLEWDERPSDCQWFTDEDFTTPRLEMEALDRFDALVCYTATKIVDRVQNDKLGVFRAIRITNQLGGLHEEHSPGFLYDLCRFLDRWRGCNTKCMGVIKTLLDHLMLAIAATFQRRWCVWDNEIRERCEDDTVTINGVILFGRIRHRDTLAQWTPQLPETMINSPTRSTGEGAQTNEDTPTEEATRAAEDTPEH